MIIRSSNICTDRIMTTSKPVIITYLPFVCLSVLRARDQTEIPDFVSQGCQDAERVNNSPTREVVYEQLNCSDTNENSLSDKSRRANCVKRNQMNNNPADDL